MNKLMRAIGVAAWFAVCWTVAVAAHPRAADAAPDATGTESLGSRLMDGLPVGADLPVADPEADRRLPVRGGARAVPAVPTDREEEGEDIGGPSGPLPLVRVQYGMRTAQALLMESTEVEQAGRVQEEVVSELDALIDELSKQCRSCACQNSEEKPSASRRSSVGSTAAEIKPGRGSAPARDSNDRLDHAGAQTVDSADVQPLLERLWGHLPERVRQQMLQSYSDGFLPEYELEIEKYYRRLAEEGDEGGAN